MSVYSPQRKAIYLSPNRLDVASARGLSDDRAIMRYYVARTNDPESMTPGTND
jgi:hypothetical protein